MDNVQIISFRSGQAGGGAGYVTESELVWALSTKQDTLVFDSTPTAGSLNPVTSDGVHSAIESATSTQVVVVGALPPASADTLGKTYYVGPQVDNSYDRYITSYDGDSYTWVAIGSTGDLNSKQDVVPSAVEGNFAVFNASGSTIDSGYYITIASTAEITNLFV